MPAKCVIRVTFTDKSKLVGDKSFQQYEYYAMGTVDAVKQFPYAIVHTGGDNPKIDDDLPLLKIVKVVEVIPWENRTFDNPKPIVAMFDLNNYTMELTKRERRNQIEKELERRYERVNKTQRLSIMFAGDKDAEALLEELKRLE